MGSRPNAVHVAYLARGQSDLIATLLAAHDLLLASATPQRLCFHLLLDVRGLLQLESAPNATALLARAGMQPALSRRIFVVNATVAALDAALGDEGRRWLHLPPPPPSALPAAQDGKDRLYTAPKLFMHELLPPFVEQCLVLDCDVLALGDACALADAAAGRFASSRRAALIYAHEQATHYERFDQAGLFGRPRPREPPGATRTAFGFNGGVAVLQLARLRTEPRYPALLAAVREAATALPAETATHLADTRLGRGVYPLDDQTALTLAAGWHGAEMAALLLPLPCEWNWQVSLGWYTKLVKGRPIHTTDGTCYEPPALLHANAMLKPVVRALHRRRAPSADGSEGETRLSRETLVDALGRYFAGRVEAGRCARASLAIPSIRSRFCNATFLLQRAPTV